MDIHFSASEADREGRRGLGMMSGLLKQQPQFPFYKHKNANCYLQEQLLIPNHYPATLTPKAGAPEASGSYTPLREGTL